MSVSKRRHRNGRPERRIVVRGIRRETPDLPKLARALLLMAQREADAERLAHEREDRNAKDLKTAEPDAVGKVTKADIDQDYSSEVTDES